MGEVYRARDTKLGRDVAIKVLPEEFSQHKERLAKFEREARLLASVNHPNIATLHGLEDADGIRFLVMELVEGETLAERIAQGPIPIDEALPLFLQIAEGLEAAHEKSVIHRDLKPANIKIGPDGSPKILDFGLAKGEFVQDVKSESPTVTRQETETGVILGTPAYMSPEQARGKTLDKRTDIWSFGCCLYEAVTGKTAFLGETVSDTIAKILEGEPDWGALPEHVPLLARSLLRRCLQKDPRRRLHDIADARIELDEAQSVPAAGETTASPRTVLPWVLVALMAVLAGLASWASWRTGPAENQTLFRTSINLSAETRRTFFPPALSPDGLQLVHYGANIGGQGVQLYLRELDRNESTPIPGTEGGNGPFFSPDGQWVGFVAGGKLKKVRLNGAGAAVLCDAPNYRGADWSVDGTIVFANYSTGIMRVPASGGTPEVLASINPDQGERLHYWPDALPNGKGVIFSAVTGSNHDDSSIVVQSLETGERRFLLNASYARYAPTGHLIYAREDTLYAIPFDLDRMEVRGTGIPVQTGVVVLSTGTGSAHFTFSDTGTLVYRARPPGIARLVLVDLQGTAAPLAAPLMPYSRARFSPDGRRLAVSVGRTATPHEIYVYELEQERLSLVASSFDGPSGEGFSFFSGIAWSPDGQSLAVNATAPGQDLNLFSLAVDGSGPAERLTEGAGHQYPDALSADGERLLYTDTQHQDWGIFELTLADRTSRTVLDPKGKQTQPVLSPDGLWMAYTSNESGRNQVYITPYERPGGRQQVSTDGGTGPVWSPDQAKLYYMNRNEMLRVEVSRPELSVGPPQLLFEGGYWRGGADTDNPRAYDLAPDGKRFVFIQFESEWRPEFQVVQNWFQELKRLAPTDN